MRLNEKDTTGSTRNPEGRVRLVFDRISRHAVRLSKTPPAIGDVHRFRTNSRRVEALIGDLAPESRNKKKLLKLLARLRKKVGKLRDLNVEISFLQNLRISDRHNHRSQLMEWLKSEQARRARRLHASFDSGTVRELRKRLRRSLAEMKLEKIDPLKLAASHLPKPGQVELNEKTLHACRIAAKHARYLAELADSADAKSFVEQLKSAQDEIGEWHDVLKLKEKAEQRFGSVHDSPLVAALENIGRACFRRARLSLLGTLAELSKRQPETAKAKKAPGRKPAGSDSAAIPVAVA
jgi:CHAD domain-containing protein